MKRPYAALIVLLLTGSVYIWVVHLVGDGGGPQTAVPPGKASRAALAIRDDVTPFQKWGTLLFTRCYLDRYYDASWYFTQNRKGALAAEFTACLDQALERYPNVDLFLLGHKNRWLEWVTQLPEEKRQRIRFVYNTGCHNQKQGPRWLELGADAYAGHPGESCSPVFYYFFLRRWCRGISIQEAAAASNQLMERTFKAWETITGERGTAAALMAESKASWFGNGGLCVEDDQQ